MELYMQVAIGVCANTNTFFYGALSDWRFVR